jgi:hypothetical protein
MSARSRKADLRNCAAAIATATTVGLGVAAGAVTSPAHASPAASAASWQKVRVYPTQALCLQFGREYEREGWRYRCLATGAGWELQIYE